MPWSRLRTTRSGDTTADLRRHSIIDPLLYQKTDEQNRNNNALRLGHDTLESVKTPSPLRNSFEPSAVEQATSSTERAQTPILLEQPQKRQRFSILKYRHASDPQVDLSFSLSYTISLPARCGGWANWIAVYQISKTARDHELAPVPPMPAGKIMKLKDGLR